MFFVNLVIFGQNKHYRIFKLNFPNRLKRLNISFLGQNSLRLTHKVILFYNGLERHPIFISFHTSAFSNQFINVIKHRNAIQKQLLFDPNLCIKILNFLQFFHWRFQTHFLYNIKPQHMQNTFRLNLLSIKYQFVNLLCHVA